MPSTEESGSVAKSESAKAGKASKEARGSDAAGVKEKDAKVTGKNKDKEKDRKKETENGKEKAKDKEKEVLKDKTKDKEKAAKEKEKKRDRRSEEEEEEEEEDEAPRKRESSNRRTKERSRKRRAASESEESRSRDRRKRREKERYRDRDRDRQRARDRVHERDRSRSRDTGGPAKAKDVKATATAPAAAPARPAPVKSAEDLAREKAEFEAFCQAQAAMAERAQAPAGNDAPGSMVLALGNFGGRAAGQGAPGQNDQISLFCRASGVDQRAEISLRGLPVHLAAEIMAAGPILGVNSSAVLMARIHKAEQMSRTRNLSLGNTAAVQAAHASGDLVTAFIAQYGVDASAEGALRALPVEAQRQIIGEGPLRGLNASALLMSRIRRVQGSLSTAAPMGPGGMPAGKIAL